MREVNLHIKMDFEELDDNALAGNWLDTAVCYEIESLLRGRINDYLDWKEYGVEIDEESVTVVIATAP